MSHILAQIGVRNSLGEKNAFFTFAIVWVILGISSFLFFHLNRDAALKRRIFPIFVISVGVVFGCFVAYMSRGYLQVLFVAIPMISLITFLNLRKTRFCDACGRTLYQQPIFSRSQFCPRCGAQLK